MLQPKDIDWLNGYKNKTPIYVVYKRPTSDLVTQTDSEGMKKVIPCKWKSKKSWSNNTHIRQNRLYLFSFLAVLGLRCCTQAFSSCGEWGLLFVAVHGLLTVVASLVVEQGL